MQFCFSSDTPSSFGKQLYSEAQIPLFPRSQSPCFDNFSFDQAKQPSFSCENQISFFVDTDTFLTGDACSSNFTSVEENGSASPYFRSFFDKDRFYDNLTLSTDFIPSSRNHFEAQGTQAFFQNSVEALPSSHDTFMYNLKKASNIDKLQYQQIQSPQSDTVAADISQTTSDSPLIHKTNLLDETALTSDNIMKGWNQDDEKLLRQLAVQYKFDWKKIAKKFDNKKYTPHFLKMRYKGYDEGPVPKRVKFTHEEDMLIARYFAEYGVDWEKMSSHFLNRTPVMIKNRYYSHIRKNKRLESLLKEMEKPETTCMELNKLALSENSHGKAAIRGKNDECLETIIEMSEEEARKNEEVVLLRAQVRSLKSLYLTTHKELIKLKNKRSRGKPNYVF